MAAGHSNRSPSPLCSRPATSNTRNSEKNSGTRRSFSGNNNPLSKPSPLTNSRRFEPFTPANSPSDFARRSSVGEEKENDEREKTLKASKLQSPAAKGGKNFMSPTISAASKFTPSPRKKVLVERNDPVRTSISLSDGKAMFFSNNISPNVSQDFSSKSEMGFHQNQKVETEFFLVDSKVADSEKKVLESKPSKRVSFSDLPPDSFQYESESESVITSSDALKFESISIDHDNLKDGLEFESISTDHDSLKFDSNSTDRDSLKDGLKFESISSDHDSLKPESSLKSEAVPSSTSIAPLDADPSLPPYDPKTNYLSPRPQFLHYKPNPRIGILLNKEKGLDPEEDNLIQELLSESFSDDTEESGDIDEESVEMEVMAAPTDLVIGMDEVGADSHVSEPLPLTDEVTDLVQKNGKKSRLICFSMLLMLFVACVSVSVTHYPSLDEYVIKDLSLSDLSNFYHQSRAAVSSSTKTNLGRLARCVDQLSVTSVSLASKFARELGIGIGGEKHFGVQFMNLSELGNKARLLHSIENLEEDELEEDLNSEEIDELEEEEEAYEDFEFDEEFEDGFGSQDDGLVTETENMFGEEAATESVEVAESEQQIQTEIIDTNEQQTGELLASIVPQHQETNLEAATEVADIINVETEKLRVDITTTPAIEDAYTNAETEDIQSSSEDNSFANKAMGISSLFAGFLAVVGFIYQYKRKSGLASVVETNPPLLNKGAGYGLKETELSRNWDVNGGESPCPSEMSSSFFQKSASYSKNHGEGANEVESTERKKAATRKSSKRRESSASSSEISMGSASYGSFTTYERIPIKHANGEEEIVTPVRRSSRLRNHQFD